MKISKAQEVDSVVKRPKLLSDDNLREKLKDNSKMHDSNEKSTAEATFYGLPEKVKEIFKESRNITSLYDWQDTCLKQPSVENGRNLIISLPTGGGKTLIAEILILKQLLLKARDALFVLPFVSIVQEKIKSLLPFGLELDFLVEEYAASKGRIPPIKRKKKRSVYVATIEKAHGLVNSLIESRSLDTLGLIVVDEFHMIGDGTSRGACIEQIISKVLFASSSTQIIGISATLSNVEELQKFLRADLFVDNFRPVALTEYVKFGKNLYKINPNLRSPDDVVQLCRELPNSTAASDPDGVAILVNEIIPNDSCLIFCPSKKNCENVALLLAKILPKSILEYRKAERKTLLKALWSECDSNLCPTQRACIPFGIAYHHSGLTADERKLIQDAFLEGTLSVLCCTSTLAAGVNLPAKRVILRSPLVGASQMSKQQYKQMSGRAGRAGLDSSGESILIIQSNQKKQVLDMLCSSYDRCRSSLTYDDGVGLKNLLLNVVGLELVSSKSSLITFFQSTLIWTQLREKQDELIDTVEAALRYLTNKNLLTLETDSLNECEIQIKITNFGKAVLKGCIDIEFATNIYEDLKRAGQCLILSTRLHLLYCVIPYDQVSDVDVDWNIFYEEYSQTSAEEKRLFELLNISETYLMKRTYGTVQSKASASDQRVLNRLYLSLALKRLWRQETVWAVAERFSLTRGFVQNLLQSCASFASCLTRFCEVQKEITLLFPFEEVVGFLKNIEELWAFQCLLPDFAKQLAYCVNMELIPLMEIQGVKQGRARQLFNAGFKTVSDLANVDSEMLLGQIDHLSRRQARQIIAGAKMLFHEKLELLREQAEEFLSNTTAKGNVSVEDVVAALRDFD